MKSLLIVCLILFAGRCTAQLYLEPMVGYGIDVRKSSFKQINIGAQLVCKGDDWNELIIQVKGSLPIPSTSYDSAFSPNPALPIYTKVEKKFTPLALSTAVGWRIWVAGAKGRDKLAITPMAGIKYEHIGVAYSYDKGNYTILNPDKAQQRLGLFGSFAVEYIHLLKRGRLFTQLNIATPSYKRKNNYPYSFHPMIPVSLNIGYPIPLKKR